MKSLNFKRKENAQLRYIEEQVTGKRKSRFNWDRVVYLSILGLILFFVLRYFFINNFYITANGSVIFNTMEVTQTEDVRIEKFFFAEGDNVKAGDTLFTYMVEAPMDALSSSEPEAGQSNWSDREVYSLEKKMDLNNSKIRSDKELLESYKGQLSSMENDVILGTASDKDLTNLEYQIGKLESNIKLLRSENSVLSKQLKALQVDGLDGDGSIGQSAGGEYSPYGAYISPIDGYISRIYKEQFEIALKSQIILNVHQADSVFIKGYFEQEDLKYVEVGDLVQVSFPDGKESEGVIERFYSSTVMIPEEFQKKFEPAKRTIAVDIKPAEGSDLDIWKRYYKLSVKLTKRTF